MHYVWCMTKITHNPHDKLVKKFLQDRKVASDLLKNHLPAHVLKELDLSKLQATSETAIDEGWKEFHNDIVFHCKTKKGDDTYIYALIEHQSTPDPFMPLRLLRYKLNIVGKYLDAKKKPDKIPNVVALVIYNGAGTYPYAKDIFSCFQNPALAKSDITNPMNLLDLSEIPAKEITRMGGADAVLKLLLKFSRELDFIQKIKEHMYANSKIFVTLSETQARFMYEYVLFVGSGTKENANTMNEAIQQTYGADKATKIFSLFDYFKQEAMQEGKKKGIKEGIKEGKKEGIKEGKKEGIKKGIEQRNLEIAKQMISEGLEKSIITKVTSLSYRKIEALAASL